MIEKHLFKTGEQCPDGYDAAYKDPLNIAEAGDIICDNIPGTA